MVNFIPSLMDHIHENIDHTYREEKEENKKTLQLIGLISAATLVSSIALAALGIALTASGGLVVIAGLSLILGNSSDTSSFVGASE